MQLTVHVTDEDISAGVKRSSISCPVARAIRRCLGIQEIWGVQVSSGRVCLFSPPHNIGWSKLPDEARRFILDFDRGQKVSSFIFHLPTEDAVSWT